MPQVLVGAELVSARWDWPGSGTPGADKLLPYDGGRSSASEGTGARKVRPYESPGREMQDVGAELDSARWDRPGSRTPGADELLPYDRTTGRTCPLASDV